MQKKTPIRERMGAKYTKIDYIKSGFLKFIENLNSKEIKKQDIGCPKLVLSGFYHLNCLGVIICNDFNKVWPGSKQ
jgi:hypothetical protein